MKKYYDMNLELARTIAISAAAKAEHEQLKTELAELKQRLAKYKKI